VVIYCLTPVSIFQLHFFCIPWREQFAFKSNTTRVTNGVLILMSHPFVVGFVFPKNLF